LKEQSNLIPIFEIEKGRIYFSGSGRPFRVEAIGRHGQDCSIGMVAYVNMLPTKDYPSGQLWFIPESIFLKSFFDKDK
jgi:hypothetical protein